MLEYLPFIATENLLMSAVKKGGDRQRLHEVIRRNSMAATARMKEGESCDLLDRLAADPEFPLSFEEITAVMNPSDFIGRAPHQVEEFISQIDFTGADDEKVEINV